MHIHRLGFWIMLGVSILGITLTSCLAPGAWMIVCLWVITLLLAVADLLAPFILPPIGMKGKGRKDKCSRN